MEFSAADQLVFHKDDEGERLHNHTDDDLGMEAIPSMG